MNNAVFSLKPVGSLTAADFERAPLWAGYYEPDDLTEMVRWGIPEDVARNALDEIGWEDDHYFPLPLEAANSDWMRGKLFGVTATGADGSEFSGYVGGGRDYIALFVGDQTYTISSLFPDGLDRLERETEKRKIAPFSLVNRVTGEHWTYTPN